MAVSSFCDKKSRFDRRLLSEEPEIRNHYSARSIKCSRGNSERIVTQTETILMNGLRNV